LTAPQGKERRKIRRCRAKPARRNHQGSEEFFGTDVISKKRVYCDIQGNSDIRSRKDLWEGFYDFALSFLPLLPLFPAQYRAALFLPASCSCFSMALASM
jgi:hypothetical protein